MLLSFSSILTLSLFPGYWFRIQLLWTPPGLHIHTEQILPSSRGYFGSKVRDAHRYVVLRWVFFLFLSLFNFLFKPLNKSQLSVFVFTFILWSRIEEKPFFILFDHQTISGSCLPFFLLIHPAPLWGINQINQEITFDKMYKMFWLGRMSISRSPSDWV